MPLTIYRRHLATCKHDGKPRREARSQKCSCPIWVQGSLGGEYLRRSLDLVSWEAAQDRVRGWEASGEVGVIKPAVPTVSEAIDRFFEDADARGLAEATIGKLSVLLRKQLLPWCRSKGYLSLKQLTVDNLTQFRATWPDSPISKYKKQERLKNFFHFCVAREWVRTNPVLGIKPVKVPLSPTLPFEEKQVMAILDTCDRYPIKGIYNHGNRQRMKALTLLMRYSGLRIGDAVTCARDRLVGSKLFLYQAKTGTPVYCPLPPVVVDALSAVEGQNAKYFFWTGNGKRKSAVADAQRSFRKLFELAEVDGHPHMFRNTFAVELLKNGVSIETVSMLLGHSSIKVTEKHYKPWVKTLQDKLETEAMKGWPSQPRGRKAGAAVRGRSLRATKHQTRNASRDGQAVS